MMAADKFADLEKWKKLTTRLDFNIDLVQHYHSASQIARIITEAWVKDNMFCPQCGHLHIEHFENNRPVADFFCPICRNEYELKSKNGPLGYKVADGNYETMIERITGNENPDFFFMNYSKESFKVIDFIFIPRANFKTFWLFLLKSCFFQRQTNFDASTVIFS